MSNRATQDIFIAVDDNGRALSKKAHLYVDCSMDRDNKPRRITDSEQQLIVVSQCAVYEKRRSGGPAIDVLEGFFSEDYPTFDFDIKNEGPRWLAEKLF